MNDEKLLAFFKKSRNYKNVELLKKMSEKVA